MHYLDYFLFICKQAVLNYAGKWQSKCAFVPCEQNKIKSKTYPWNFKGLF